MLPCRVDVRVGRLLLVVPTAFSLVTHTRLQLVLHTKRARDAKFACWAAVSWSLLLSLAASLVLLCLLPGVAQAAQQLLTGGGGGRNSGGSSSSGQFSLNWAYIFTSFADVAARMDRLYLPVAAMQVLASLCMCYKGILRGQQRHNQVAAFTGGCVWLLGCPLGYYWGFVCRPRYGMIGLLSGVAIGFCALTISLSFMVHVMTDWKREVRRNNVRLQAMYHATAMMLVLPTSLHPLSASLGGFDLGVLRRYHVTEEDEMDVLEEVDGTRDHDHDHGGYDIDGECDDDADNNGSTRTSEPTATADEEEENDDDDVSNSD